MQSLTAPSARFGPAPCPARCSVAGVPGAPLLMPDTVWSAPATSCAAATAFCRAGAIGDLAMGGPIIAPLARTADSRLVVVRSFRTTIFEGGQPVATIDYPGETIAPAAVSRSHVFLSTTGSMRSYDARSLALVGKLSCFGGGQSSPSIAASGRIYALASKILFIWLGPDTGTQEPSRDVAPRPREGLLDPGAERPARRLPAWPRAAAASARLPAESCSGIMDGLPLGKER
jgi:hypothetical protein